MLTRGRPGQRGKDAAGEFLAIPAMAHCCARRVGLGCVAHRAAEAAAFDLPLDPRDLLPFDSKPNEVLPIHRPLPMVPDQLCGQPPGGQSGPVIIEQLLATEPGIGVPQGNTPDRDRTNTKP
jgi:hypothetical protein